MEGLKKKLDIAHHDLVDKVVIGERLDLLILEVFSNLNDSVIVSLSFQSSLGLSIFEKCILLI